ncbi:MAG: HlyD family efflux transporter periplasmic adaptor subunit [Planctomycetaceae bacterium]
MKLVRRLLLGLLGLVVLGGLVYAFLPQPVPADTAVISRGPLSVTVNEDGKTRIRERYVVSTPLAGQLRRVELEPGDPVRASETVLATILPDTPKLLDPRERAEAEARVSAAEAAVSRAKTNIESAKVAEEVAASQFERIRRLEERSAASEQRLEEVTLTMRARQEEHRSAQFSLQIAEFELAQAKAALQRFEPPGAEQPAGAGEQYHFEIRSPISGRVLRVLQKSAAVLASGTPILELGDPTNLELEVDVLSTDAVKIEPGDKIRLEHWGGDEPLTGVVRLIEPAAFTKISALGVEEQRVYVIGDLTVTDAQRARLGDAFRFEARIVVWEENDVLQCPTSALFRQEDRWAVFVLENNRAVLRTVQLGHRNADAAQILDGIKEGERVIIYPSDRVQPGVAIAVRNGR